MDSQVNVTKIKNHRWILPNIQKTNAYSWERERLSSSFYEASITLIQNHIKILQRKKIIG